ncbi:MAG TPA: PepSY-associated TM helix domain-containing protein [Iamia sp.]
MSIVGDVEAPDETSARLERLRAGRAPTVARVPRRTRVRRALHRQLTARRGPIVVLHRWVSLVLVAWIVVESLTGALLVFEPQLTSWWNRDDIQVTAGDVGMADAARAASEAVDDAPVTFVSAPDGDGSAGMYQVVVRQADGDAATVLVDPGSGEVTTTDHRMPVLLRWAFEVHVRLNSTSIGGFAGLTVVGAFGVAWLLVMLSGLYVWYWPGVKRWANALRVRRRRGRFTWNLDLHKALGIVVWLPLVLVIVTGINLAFPRQVEDVYRVVVLGTFDHPETDTPLSTVAPTPPIGPEEARRAVAALDPSIDVESVGTPAGSPVGVYTVSARVDPSFLGQVGGERPVSFAVDQYSGAVVSVDDHRLDGASVEAYETWSYPVHVGSFGGTTTRWIWVALGLAPVVMSWTGVRMWLDRRRKRTQRPAEEETLQEEPS